MATSFQLVAHSTCLDRTQLFKTFFKFPFSAPVSRSGPSLLNLTHNKISSNGRSPKIRCHYNRPTSLGLHVFRTLKPVSASRELTSFSFSKVRVREAWERMIDHLVRERLCVDMSKIRAPNIIWLRQKHRNC